MRRFIIDTDVGTDDAVALIMALHHPDIQVEAITAVSGNVEVEKVARNILYVVELCEADVPVYQGMTRPIIRPPYRAYNVHGEDGLGDLGVVPSQGQLEDEHAVDALIRHLMAAPGEITLITLGPLTNVAMALLKEPRLAGALQSVIMMGGTANALGNVTPSAEFNVWCDPEAAKILFHSGVPVTMIGWELVWDDMLVTVEEMERLRATGSRYADFALDCNRKAIDVMEQRTGTRALALPDPITMAVAIDRSVCRTEKLYVTVETSSDLTRGETVVDRRGRLGQEPNTEVCFDPDAAKFKQLLFDALT